MRLIHRQDHLQRRPAVVHAAQRLPIFLNGCDEVFGNPYIAHAKPAVLERLRFAESVTGNLVPRICKPKREPAPCLGFWLPNDPWMPFTKPYTALIWSPSTGPMPSPPS